MSWSTVEWPPKNNVKLQAKSKHRKKLKVVLLLFLLIAVLSTGYLLGQSNWQPLHELQQKIAPIKQYLSNDQPEQTKNDSAERQTTDTPSQQSVPAADSNANASSQPQQALIVSRSGEQIRYTREYQMLATAYTHTGNPTASGVWPKVGVAAVDTNIIPMGTRLYVEGYGYATALDRGGAIKGHRIDLFMDTESQALQWGAQKVKVYILE